MPACAWRAVRSFTFDMKKNDIVTLTVEAINNLGAGVAHLSSEGEDNGMVVFVQGAVTGDVVEAKLIKVNKSYLVARVERLITPSPLRADGDVCPAAGCGGCIYRLVSYSHELALKCEQVKAAFQKAGLSEVLVGEVVATGVTQGYRNKAQYPVQNGKNGMQAGFFAASSHRIVPVECCALQPPVFSDLTAHICAFCNENGIRAYEEETGRGLLRHIYLRRGSVSGEIMVCLVVNGERLPGEEALAASIAARFPDVKSILLNVNRRNTNVVLGKDYRLLWGRDSIEDTLSGRVLRISAAAFYQVNHDACERLYAIAREKAELTPEGTLLDLYCGIGTVGLSMADATNRLIGVEIVPEAVECAKENATRNGLANARFFCGDASDADRFLSAAEGDGPLDPDTTVILDPPRKGSTPALLEALARRNFSRIVYISCNPDTLARDCAYLKQLGYCIGEVTPVDMFPRTGHVETVVLLSKGEIDSKKIRVEFSMEGMDMSGFQKDATYGQIKECVLEQTGLKVSSLYIAQVKQKHGIIERENYNKPKSDNARQPQCSPEKEKAITDALKYFGMI